MYRLLSDSAISGVPTVVIPGVVAATGSSPVPAAQTSNVESAKPMPIDTGNSDAEMLMLIQKDKERNQTTSTTFARKLANQENFDNCINFANNGVIRKTFGIERKREDK